MPKTLDISEPVAASEFTFCRPFYHHSVCWSNVSAVCASV
jgi:hypothetical protein